MKRALTVKEKGSWKNIEDELYDKNASKKFNYSYFQGYAEAMLESLKRNTPEDSGKTADSWFYEIKQNEDKSYEIIFYNSNVVSGANVAILIEYGHATGSGGWVEAQPYIKDALQPYIDQLQKDMWKEVK